MRTTRTSQPLARVLAQVERRQHAERRHGERHQEHHHHGAEDRREDAALGVRLARLVEEELAQRARRRARACRPARARWPHRAHDVASGIAFSRPSAVRMTSVSAPSSLSRCASSRAPVPRTVRASPPAVALLAGASRSSSRFCARLSARSALEPLHSRSARLASSSSGSAAISLARAIDRDPLAAPHRARDSRRSCPTPRARARARRPAALALRSRARRSSGSRRRRDRGCRPRMRSRSRGRALAVDGRPRGRAISPSTLRAVVRASSSDDAAAARSSRAVPAISASRPTRAAG